MREDAISDQFIAEHYTGLQALLQRRIGDAAIAAEMLNEAIATAIVHMRQGRVAQPERLAGYVFRVAMNLYRNYRREFDNRAELRAGGDAVQQLPGANNVEDALDTGVVQAVRAIVASLPTARDREIVKRFYLDEEDKEQICRSLGLGALHFDKVIFRARQRLRALLEARGFRKSDLLGVLLVGVA
ncbi:MAG TPA: sigma-70 family RNA polymerase sigma factor [Steroidobacteraceae bacterium]